MAKTKFERMIAAARKRVAAMDAIDGHGSWPCQLPRTAAMAIEMGVTAAVNDARDFVHLTFGDVGCVLDAMVYMEQLAAHFVAEAVAAGTCPACDGRYKCECR